MQSIRTRTYFCVLTPACEFPFHFNVKIGSLKHNEILKIVTDAFFVSRLSPRFLSNQMQDLEHFAPPSICPVNLVFPRFVFVVADNLCIADTVVVILGHQWTLLLGSLHKKHIV